MAQIEALNQRGRGKKRFETVSALRQAVVAIVQRYGVEDLVWFRLTPHVTPRPVRAYRGQPARVDHDRHATVEVRVDEAALEATSAPVGVARLRHEPTDWRRCHWRKRCWPIAVNIRWSAASGGSKDARCRSRPCMCSAMTMPQDSFVLLSIALRVLTLLEFVGRRQLATEGAKLAGLYAGNPKRETDRPTAERLLEAFQDITLTIIKGPQQTARHVTALSPLQQRILEVLGFSSALYTRLCTVSSEPP